MNLFLEIYLSLYDSLGYSALNFVKQLSETNGDPTNESIRS
jgi:hypothetical protein